MCCGEREFEGEVRGERRDSLSIQIEAKAGMLAT